MLSNEDNELLCRVGKGTPMGELFRRFWLPAALSSELAKDGEVRRLRILGEDLIAFRDSSGQAGVVSPYCPHKLAPLYFGRNEEDGLRCVYHGWKFDRNGQCVEIPNLPGSAANLEALKKRVAITSYPLREGGGFVWIYMGEPERMPQMPEFEWLDVSPDQVHATRWLQRTNWVQGMEGEIDSSHVSFLHRSLEYPSGLAPEIVNLTAPIPIGTKDGSPVMTIKETPYGFVYGARRNHDSGNYLWRVTQWYVPMFSMIPNGAYPRSGRAWVPIDDYNVMVFNYAYNKERPFTREEWNFIDSGPSFPSPQEEMDVELDDGYVIDTWVPLARKSNNYGLSRVRQRRVNYSGIKVVTDQDRALQENMPSAAGVRVGGIVDRSREMLVSSDAPVITARRILLQLANNLMKGIEPPQAADGSLYKELSMSALAPQAEFDDFLAAQAGEPVAT